MHLAVEGCQERERIDCTFAQVSFFGLVMSSCSVERRLISCLQDATCK